tara:strand:- start:507 stop:818 length:312 start_codon:yes stop_codon:yes gene_type:complete
MEINELIDKRQNLENMLKEVNKDIEKETTKTKPKQYNVNFVIGVNCSMTVLAHSKELAKEIIDEFIEDVQFSGELHDQDFEDTVEDGYYEKSEGDKPQYLFLE